VYIVPRWLSSIARAGIAPPSWMARCSVLLWCIRSYNAVYLSTLVYSLTWIAFQGLYFTSWTLTVIVADSSFNWLIIGVYSDFLSWLIFCYLRRNCLGRGSFLLFRDMCRFKIVLSHLMMMRLTQLQHLTWRCVQSATFTNSHSRCAWYLAVVVTEQVPYKPHHCRSFQVNISSTAYNVYSQPVE